MFGPEIYQAFIAVKRAFDPDNLLNPLGTPVEIFILLATILVNIVLVADIERRVGKSQVHDTRFQPREASQAVFLVDGVKRGRQGSNPFLELPVFVHLAKS